MLNILKIYITVTPERIKIKKIKKIVANLHDKANHLIHMRNFKQALNHGLVLKKVRRIIKFNQKT